MHSESFDVLSVKIHAGVSAVGDWKNQKSSKHGYANMGGVYFAYMGRRNPLTDWVQFFLAERYPWRNHACQTWWRSLKGFRGSCGSNFSISHWLCWSSLQHSHTTVWACDERCNLLEHSFPFENGSNSLIRSNADNSRHSEVPTQAMCKLPIILLRYSGSGSECNSCIRFSSSNALLW